MFPTQWIRDVVRRLRRANAKRDAQPKQPLLKLEELEDRTVLTTVFLDFGLGFPQSGLNPTVAQLRDIDGPDTGPDLKGRGPDGNKLTDSDAINIKPMSLARDMNRDGKVNDKDMKYFQSRVLSLVQQIYQPFDIQVEVSQAKSLADVRKFLAKNGSGTPGSNDAYVIIADFTATKFSGGSVGDATDLWGISSGTDLNTGANQTDEVVFSFAENLNADFPSDYGYIRKMAQNAAHEAGHSLGLAHPVRSTDIEGLLSKGDVLRPSSSDAVQYSVYRFDLKNEHNPNLTNRYEQFRDDPNIGANTKLSYVTGTGLHDEIHLTPSVLPGFIDVIVDAYRDSTRQVHFRNESYAIFADVEDIRIDASYGNDLVVIHPDITANVVVYGGPDDDEIRGGSGNNTLYGDGGSDTLIGGAGNDVLYGGANNDVLRGGDGNDLLEGQSGDDELMGGSGEDTLEGGRGSDTLRGGTDDDTLYGGKDADDIDGEGNHDTIYRLETIDTAGPDDDVELIDAAPPAGSQQGTSGSNTSTNSPPNPSGDSSAGASTSINGSRQLTTEEINVLKEELGGVFDDSENQDMPSGLEEAIENIGVLFPAGDATVGTILNKLVFTEMKHAVRDFFQEAEARSVTDLVGTLQDLNSVESVQAAIVEDDEIQLDLHVRATRVIQTTLHNVGAYDENVAGSREAVVDLEVEIEFDFSFGVDEADSGERSFFVRLPGGVHVTGKIDATDLNFPITIGLLGATVEDGRVFMDAQMDVPIPEEDIFENPVAGADGRIRLGTFPKVDFIPHVQGEMYATLPFETMMGAANHSGFITVTHTDLSTPTTDAVEIHSSDFVKQFTPVDSSHLVRWLTEVGNALQAVTDSEALRLALPFVKNQQLKDIAKFGEAFRTQILDVLVSEGQLNFQGIQEFVSQLTSGNSAGVDVIGMDFDPTTQELSIRFDFSYQVVNRSVPLGARRDVGSLLDLNLSTQGQVDLSGTVSGSLNFGIDLSPETSEVSSPLDRFFLRNASVRADGSVSMDGVEATARLGLFEAGLENGQGGIEAGIALHLENHTGSLRDVEITPEITGAVNVSFDAEVQAIDVTTITLTGDLVHPSTLTAQLNPEIDIEDILSRLAIRHFVEGLEQIVDLARRANGLAMFSQEIPVINRSVSELLGTTEKLNALDQELDEMKAAPPTTIDEVVRRVKGVFGEVIKNVRLEDGVLEFQFTENVSHTREVDLSFDLARTDADLLSEFVGAEVSAPLQVQLAASTNLEVVIDLDDPTNPYLKDTSFIQAEAFINASDIDLSVDVLGFGLHVKDGTVRLFHDQNSNWRADSRDRDNNGVSDEAARWSVWLTPTSTRRHSLRDVIRNFSEVVQFGAQGRLDIDLPVYAPTPNQYRGSFEARVYDLTDPIGSARLLSEPNLEGVISDLNLSDALDAIIEGVDRIIGMLETALESKVAGKLPLLGKQFHKAAGFLGEFRESVIQRLESELEEFGALTEERIQSAMFEVFGPKPDGLGWLVDGNNDGEITPEDLGFERDQDKLTFDFGLAGEWEVSEALGIDFGFDNLGLDVDGELQLEVDFRWNVGFGVSREDGFYLIHEPRDSDPTATAEDIPELEVEVNATISNPESNTFTTTGTLGFLALQVTDVPNDENQYSYANAVLKVDFEDPSGDNHLTARELISAPTDVFDVSLAAEVDVELKLEASFAANTSGPSLETEFHFEWDSNPEDNTPPLDIAFRNAQLELGDLISQVISPVAQKLHDVVRPIRPIVDALRNPIPGISKVVGDISLLDLAEEFFEVKAGTAASIEAFGNALDTILGLESRLNNSDNNYDQVSIQLGSLSLNQNGEPEWESLSGNDGPQNDKIDDLKSESGFSIPLFDDPTQAFGLLFGKDVTLVSYDLPKIQWEVGGSYSFKIFPGLSVDLEGNVGLKADLGFGFDTSGFRQFAQAGYEDWDLIANGFYVRDVAQTPDGTRDVPELEFYGGLKAYGVLDAIIASAGVGGGLTASLTLDLNDPNNDGKVNLPEVFSQLKGDGILGRIFDIEGELAAELSAFLKVGWGPFSKTWRKNFAKVPIWSFSSKQEPKPILASVEDGVLHLHSGVDSTKRLHVDTADGDEHFRIKQTDTDLIVTFYANGEAHDQPVDRSGVTKIVAHGGVGDDRIIIDPSVTIGVELHGGPGDDYLQAGGGRATLYGDAGNDQLVAGDQGIKLYGGLGDDILTGGLGRDTLRGGEGNDELYGGNERDELRGGPGNDWLSGSMGEDTLLGEDGADTLLGGDQNDSLHGGLGDDFLQGDAGADTLVGDVGSDLLQGGSENDLLQGGRGNDLLEGGTGADTLNGEGGNDELHGGGDGDSLIGGRGSDELYGGPGEDQLHGGLGTDIVHGGPDDDRIQYSIARDEGNGLDVLRGGSEDDVIEIMGSDLDEYLRIEEISPGLFQANRLSFETEEALSTIQFGLGSDIESIWISGLGGNDTIEAADTLTVYKLILDGGAGNDSLVGSNGEDEIYGGLGDDTLKGRDGEDLLVGGPGRDSISGGGGTDVLRAEDEGDTLNGGGGRDVLEGGSEGDVLYAGNSIYGSLIYGNEGADTIFGGEGIDHLEGGEGDDFIFGGDMADVIDGGPDRDTIVGGWGRDDLDGGEGNDVIWAWQEGQLDVDWEDVEARRTSLAQEKTALENRFAEISSIPPLSRTYQEQQDFEELPDRIRQLAMQLDDLNEAQSVEIDVLVGGGDNDTLYGSPFHDEFYGRGGHDQVYDLPHHYFLVNNSSTRNRAVGTAGDDYLWVQTYGGYVYSYLWDAVARRWDYQGAFYHRYLSSIEIDGLGGNDTITFKIYDDVAADIDIAGGTGNDVVNILSTPTSLLTIDGGAGNDTLRGSEADDRIYGGAGNDLIEAKGGNDTVVGGTGEDTIYGSDGSDWIQASVGRDGSSPDLVFGGNGHDTMEVIGTEGPDNISIVGTSDAVEVSSAGMTVRHRLTSDVEFYLVSGLGGSDRIEAEGHLPLRRLEIDGGAGADTILGSDGNDHLFGGPGDDVIHGGKGRDVLEGGSGRDRLESGSDIFGDLLYGGSNDDTLIGGPGRDHLEGEGGADLLRGGDLNDVIDGGEGPDTLVGGWGRDDLDGGAGSDEIWAWFEPSDSVDVEGVDQRRAILLAEKAELSRRLVNVPEGSSEWIDLANRLRHVELQVDDVQPENGISVDILVGGDDADHLHASPYIDFLYGRDGDDRIYDHRMNHLGTDGNDDTVVGGRGEDTYLVYGTEAAEELILEVDRYYDVYATIGQRRTLVSRLEVEAAGVLGLGGADTLTLNFGEFGGMAIEVDGGAGNDVLNAESLQNSATLIGGSGADTLNSGVGVDVLYGGDGDDFLTAGNRADTIHGGSGYDTLVETVDGFAYLDDTYFERTEEFGSVSDELDSIESAHLTGGDQNDRIYASYNIIRQANFSGEITLAGGAGNDKLVAGSGDATLLGGSGNDTLEGGGGNDLLRGESGDDTLTGNLGNDVLDGGADHDELYQAADTNLTLRTGLLVGVGTDTLLNFEAVTLGGLDGNNYFDASGSSLPVTLYGGAGMDTLIGSPFDDVLHGVWDNDRIHGRDGADTIFGGTGTDYLYGEGGPDSLYAHSATALVQEWVTNHLYGGDGNDTLHGSEGVDYLYGHQGHNVLYGHGGNDWLYGDSGNDTLYGGNHNDRLYGYNGNDSLEGGYGRDSLYGGWGRDTLKGNQDDDYLDGGDDNSRDLLYGQQGRDRFVKYYRDVWSSAKRRYIREFQDFTVDFEWSGTPSFRLPWDYETLRRARYWY